MAKDKEKELLHDVMSRLGKKGAKVRDERTTPAWRKRNARKAAKARWSKRDVKAVA